MKYKDMTYAEFVKKLRVYENDCPACENDTQDFCDNYCEYNSKRGDCLLGMIDHAADAIERLMAEVDRKDKAIQGLLTQIESKDKAIERMRDLMKHYKAAYKTAYKLYQEARHDKLS